MAGRYHRAGEPWPLYAALDPPTAWAEWRATTRGGIAGSHELRRLWRLRVRDLVVLDLRRAEVRAAMGLDEGDLVGPREHPQRLAARARRIGAAGIVAPSAAQPGGFALVVFPAGFGALRVSGSDAAHPDPPS